MEALLKDHNGSAKAQHEILLGTRNLTACGFCKAHIATILKGSTYTSVKLLKAVTAVCEEEVAKGIKPNEEIVQHVRQGRKDRNRKAVVKAFLERGSING